MAFQIVNPIRTYGLAFQGVEFSIGQVNWRGMVDRHWPMSAGQWAQLRAFDELLLEDARAIMNQVIQMMRGDDISKRNAVYLLQLAWEHPHPYPGAMVSRGLFRPTGNPLFANRFVG
jgi:hypothetical protein